MLPVQNGLGARQASKEINNLEVSVNVDERVEQNWFRRFKKGNTNLEDKAKSELTSVLEDVALLQMLDQQLSTRPRNLSAELGPSQSAINRHLHALGLMNRHCR